MFKFPSHTLKCFLLLYKILVSLYLLKHIYSKVGYLVLSLLSWLAQFCSLHFPEFVKMDPKYLNGLLPLISMLCLITGIQFLNCYYNFLSNSNFSDNRLQQFLWYQVICLFQVDKTKWVYLYFSSCVIISWRQNMLSKQDLPVANPARSSDIFAFIIFFVSFFVTLLNTLSI